MKLKNKLIFSLLFFVFLILIHNDSFCATEILRLKRSNFPQTSEHCVYYSNCFSNFSFDINLPDSFITSLKNNYNIDINDYIYARWVRGGSNYYICFSDNSTFSTSSYVLEFNYWTEASTLYVILHDSSDGVSYSCGSPNTATCYSNNPDDESQGYIYRDVEVSSFTSSISNNNIIHNISLYIDDMNFRKRFQFQFQIPLEKEDTKYFIFLDNYTRNNYNSVTGDFVIYTVATPDGYDFSNYENYMYYDNIDKKLFFPAGCTIKKYLCTATNGDLFSLTLADEFVGERHSRYCYHDMFTRGDISQILVNGGLSYDITFNNLVSPNHYVADFDNGRFFMNFINSLKTIIGVDTLQELVENLGYRSTDYFYYDFLHYLYYADYDLNLKFDDFCCSNNCIVSYENIKEYRGSFMDCNFYNFYRKTKVYNMENRINDTSFAFNYSDKQDVSSMLPDGLTVGYLTSPFYKDNENSSSGGYITYNINEVIQGDKVINYSKDTDPIHENYPQTYIENFEEADNIVINNINNYNIQYIENSSDENGILQKIYWCVYNIQNKLDSMGDNISNSTTNFNYNVRNEFIYLFVPRKFALNEITDNFKTTAKSHLGIIYEPLSFLVYTVTLFSRMDNTTEILIDLPDVTFHDVTLIHQTRFSFTQYMEDLPILYNIHQIYLTAVDFIILGLLIKYAYKVYKEVFRK